LFGYYLKFVFMKSLVKWFALFAVLALAGKAFIEVFNPEYEKWREKYPPEPEPVDDEDDDDETGKVVQAQDLFKPDAVKFAQDVDDFNAKGGSNGLS
jgi:hypothetical protein